MLSCVHLAGRRYSTIVARVTTRDGWVCKEKKVPRSKSHRSKFHWEQVSREQVSQEQIHGLRNYRYLATAFRARQTCLRQQRSEQRGGAIQICFRTSSLQRRHRGRPG